METEWGRCELNREIIQRDVDIFELTEDLQYKWNLEIIVNSIINNLKQRNDDLTTIQKENPPLL